MKGPGFLSLHGHPSLPPVIRNPENERSWIFVEPARPLVMASGGSKIPKMRFVNAAKMLKIKRSPSVGRFWASLGCLLDLFRECGGSLWAALGRLWVIWGHSGGTLGSLWVALGRVWVIWGHSKGTLGITLYPSIALHKNLPKVWECCSKTHILEHSPD